MRRRVEQPASVALDGVVAFAGGFLQAFDVEHADMPPAVLDQPRLLQRIGDERHAGSPHAHHLGEKLLGQGDIVAAGQVPATQQPARDARLGRMAGIAGRVSAMA